LPNQASFLPIAGLMFLTGVGIPILAAWNAALGQQLGSATGATFVLFAVGVLLAGVLMLIVGGVPDVSRFTFDRPYAYFGVVFMVCYALAITWAAPRIGVGNAVFFVLLGQLVMAAAIDHYGLWGAIRSEVTLRRAAGVAIMAFGVYLAKKSA
jgi:transporter family-2 protein